MRNLICWGFTIAILTAFGCSNENPKYKDFIGKEYSYLSDLSAFKGFKYLKGALTQRIDTVNYGIDIYKKDSIYVVAFEYIIQKEHKANKYILIDILEINGVKKEQDFGFSICRKDEKEDKSIFVIYNHTDTEYFKNIVKAWKVNYESNRIEEISVKGIDCINEFINYQEYKE